MRSLGDIFPGVSELLPIFPLSNVVLFPRIQTPLHLFEPRYRQMAEDALAGDRKIGMVVVPPEHVEEMRGDPPIYPVGCAGVIVESQKLPDGRYNIVLAGTHRFRVLDEPEGPAERLYRVAEVERLEDPFDPSEAGRVARLRTHIIDRASELVRVSHTDDDTVFEPGAFDDIDDVAFVNALSNALDLPTPEKQGLLEADAIPERFERLASVLEFQVVEQRGGVAPESDTVH